MLNEICDEQTVLDFAIEYAVYYPRRNSTGTFHPLCFDKSETNITCPIFGPISNGSYSVVENKFLF